MIGVRQLQIVLLIAILGAAAAAAVMLPTVLGEVASHEALRARLESLQTGESRFRELVIRLRHGVTSNYDEANQWLVRIHNDQVELNRQIGSQDTLMPLLKAYKQAEKAQEFQWNDFKLRNALVRNSLRYFQKDAVNFMRDLPDDVTGDILHHELLALNNALFLQALGESREVDEIAQASLEILRPLAVALPKPLRLEFGRLSRHAEIISTHSPLLEADVQGLIHGHRLQEAGYVY